MNKNLTLALFLTAPLLAQAEGRFIALDLTGDEGTRRAIALQASFDVTVTGMIARTRLTQRFINELDQWAQGHYVLPLPDGAAVDHLQILVGDAVIKGAVVEKTAARTEYQHALRNGNRAAVVHQRQPNVFEMSIANIPPGEEVGVVVEFQQIVTLQDGRYRLRLPTTLTPQFVPPSTDTRAIASDYASKEVTDGSHRLAVTIDLAPGFAVSEIVSPSHSIEVQEASNHHRVELTGWPRMDRDLLLEWRPMQVGNIHPMPFIESFEDHYFTAMLIAAPEMLQVPAERARELILVLDRSGSMAGSPMRQAKHAIIHAIKRLESIDRFNVVLFSDRVETLFSRPHVADTQAKARALTLLDAVEADGGTEMQPALEAALWQPRTGSGLRQIMFVTDGAVANVDALGDFIAKNLGAARLFTVGIGRSPNAYFMRRAAEQGRGSYTFIADVGGVEDTMRALFDRIDRPALTDIEIRYFDPMGNEVTGHAFPVTTPDIYAGDSVMLLTRFRVAPIAAQITGYIGPTFWREDLDIRARAGSGLRVSWARKQIEALEHAERRARESDKLDLAQRITDIALRHQLTSRFTSLVAVDLRPGRGQFEPLGSGRITNLAPNGTLLATARTGSGWLSLVLAGCACLLMAIASRWFTATANAPLHSR